jgi:hypothetical protein
MSRFQRGKYITQVAGGVNGIAQGDGAQVVITTTQGGRTETTINGRPAAEVEARRAYALSTGAPPDVAERYATAPAADEADWTEYFAARARRAAKGGH